MMTMPKESELEKENCVDTISGYLLSVHKQRSGLHAETIHSLTRRQFISALEQSFRCNDTELKATEQTHNFIDTNEELISLLFNDIVQNAKNEWNAHISNITNQVELEVQHHQEEKEEQEKYLSNKNKELREEEKYKSKFVCQQKKEEHKKNNNYTSTPSFSCEEKSHEHRCMSEQSNSLAHSEQTITAQTNHNSSESFSSCISSSSSSSESSLSSSSSSSLSSSSSEMLKAEAHTLKNYNEHAGLAESTKLSECLIDACNDSSTLAALKQFLISYQRKNKANLDARPIATFTTSHYCVSVFKPMWWMLVKTLSPTEETTETTAQSQITELSETVEHSFIPTLTELRNIFMCLHPMHQFPFCDERVEASRAFESQLDYFVKEWNSGTSALSELLCCNLSLSLRRLVYAAALKLKFCVPVNQTLHSTNNVASSSSTKSISYIYNIPQLLSFHTTNVNNNITNNNTNTDKAIAKQEMSYVKSTSCTQHYTSSYRNDIINRLNYDKEFYVANDDKYFIFVDEVDALCRSELLEAIMILFTCNQNSACVCNEKENKLNDRTDVKERINCKSAPEASFTSVHMETNQMRMKMERTVDVKYKNTESKCTERPQVQLLPLLRGFTMLLAPICYMCNNTNEQVALAVAMHKELWCHVQCPSVELLKCYLLFEDVVNYFARTAYHHVIKELEYTCFMSHVVMNWITTSFTTVFTPTEVLSLEDMMLVLHLHHNRKYPKAAEFRRTNNYNVNKCGNTVNNNGRAQRESIFTLNGVLLLPLMAAALFIYRAPLVLRCQSRDEINTVFRTAHECKSKQLFQFLLFLEK